MDEQITSALNRLVGLSILDVNFGGLAGGTFSISLGQGLARESALGAGLGEKFKQTQGDHSLYVWCSWRLQAAEALASSAQEAKAFGDTLASLLGKKVTAVSVAGPLRDLRLETATACLEVFCDRVPGGGQGNWDLTYPGGGVGVGPGFELELETE